MISGFRASVILGFGVGLGLGALHPGLRFQALAWGSGVG